MGLDGKYRSLGWLTEDQLQAAADRFGLGRISGAEVLGGFNGNNLGLATQTGGWVLRGGIPPINPDTQLRRERFFARAIHERSPVPAPWPYHIDDTTEIFGWSYALMPRLPGETFHHQQSELDWERVGAALAKTASGLQEITWQCVGEWDPKVDDIVPIHDAAEWLQERVHRVMELVAKTSEPLDEASIDFVDTAVRGALPSVGDFTPTYIHGDFAVSNVAMSRRGDRFEVTGIFDLEAGYAGEPDENLAIALWWPTFWGRPDVGAAFLEAFRRLRRPREGQPERLRAYVVLDMLENWEIGQRDRQPWYGEARTFREWAQPLVGQIGEFIGK